MCRGFVNRNPLSNNDNHQDVPAPAASAAATPVSPVDAAATDKALT